MTLATTYTDLKNTGRIDAYLSKKRKRLASKNKKQMPTRRVNNDDEEEDWSFHRFRYSVVYIFVFKDNHSSNSISEKSPWSSHRSLFQKSRRTAESTGSRSLNTFLPVNRKHHYLMKIKRIIAVDKIESTFESKRVETDNHSSILNFFATFYLKYNEQDEEVRQWHSELTITLIACPLSAISKACTDSLISYRCVIKGLTSIRPEAIKLKAAG